VVKKIRTFRINFPLPERIAALSPSSVLNASKLHHRQLRQSRIAGPVTPANKASGQRIIKARHEKPPAIRRTVLFPPIASSSGCSPLAATRVSRRPVIKFCG